MESIAKSWNDKRKRELNGLSPTAQLRVVTLNLNLINGIFVRNPQYQANSQRVLRGLAHYMTSSQAPDILFLQEIWERCDHKAILSAAQAAGYEVVVDSAQQVLATGLQILVKRSAVAQIEPRVFTPFLSLRGNPIRALWERIGKVRRGILSAIVHLHDGRRIFIGTSHFTPLTLHMRVRERQVEAAQRIFPQLIGGMDAVIFGGDLNIAANDHGDATGPEQLRLQTERELYQSLHMRLGWIDTFRAANRQNLPGYTTNVEFPQTLFLRFGQNIEKRIDYVFTMDPQNTQSFYVANSQVVFTEPIGRDGKPCATGLSLSDHFGVLSTFVFF